MIAINRDSCIWKGISLNKQKSTSSSFRAPPFKSPKKIQGVLLDGYADDERHHYHPGDQSLCLAPWFLKSIGGIDLQVSILTLTYPEALESTYWGLLRYRPSQMNTLIIGEKWCYLLLLATTSRFCLQFFGRGDGQGPYFRVGMGLGAMGDSHELIQLGLRIGWLVLGCLDWRLFSTRCKPRKPPGWAFSVTSENVLQIKRTERISLWIQIRKCGCLPIFNDLQGIPPISTSTTVAQIPAINHL